MGRWYQLKEKLMSIHLYALWSHAFRCGDVDGGVESMTSAYLRRLDDRLMNPNILLHEVKRIAELMDLVHNEVEVVIDPHMCLRALVRGSPFGC